MARGDQLQWRLGVESCIMRMTYDAETKTWEAAVTVRRQYQNWDGVPATKKRFAELEDAYDWACRHLGAELFA